MGRRRAPTRHGEADEPARGVRRPALVVEVRGGHDAHSRREGGRAIGGAHVLGSAGGFPDLAGPSRATQALRWLSCVFMPSKIIVSWKLRLTDGCLI